VDRRGDRGEHPSTATAFLDPDNWLADELARKIEAAPGGFSVGFGIVKSRSKDNGGLIFDEVSLWEVSAVGIPSNPDAVNSAAVAGGRQVAPHQKRGWNQKT